MSEKKEKDIMITQDGCGYCETAKEKLKNEIDAGNIEIVPLETKRGKELMKKHNIALTPTILNRKDDGEIQKCYIAKDGEKLLCEDGSEKVIKHS